MKTIKIAKDIDRKQFMNWWSCQKWSCQKRKRGKNESPEAVLPVSAIKKRKLAFIFEEFYFVVYYVKMSLTCEEFL